MRRFTVVLLVFALFSLSMPVGAKTTRIELTGTQQATHVDPGESWVSGSILHVRGQEVTGVVLPDSSSGLTNGTSHATVNFNLDVTTFEGRVWGQGVLRFGDGGFETTFSGDIRPANVPGGLLGEFRVVGHGFGSLEGMQLRATVRENIAIGVATFEGVLFVPGDR